MPTITGNKSGTRPWLELDYTINEQDTSNNRTKITTKLYLNVVGSISYTMRGSGSLSVSPGGSYNFTAPGTRLTSAGRYLLRTQTLWVSHASDGSRSVRFNASYALNLTWNGSWVGNINLSGSASLPDIARRHTITIKNSDLKPIKQAEFGDTVRISLGRKDTSYKADIGYEFNGQRVTIAQKIDYGEYDHTIQKSMMNDVPDKDKVSVKFWVDTYNGNTKLGTDTYWLTLVMSSSVVPVIDSVVLVEQNAQAKASGKYIAGLSQLKAIVSATGVWNSSIRSVGQNLNGVQASGAEYVWTNLSAGQNKLVATVTDSRGRSASKTITFNVEQYTPPKIHLFVPARTGDGTNTSVKAVVNVSTSGLGSDTINIKIQRKLTSASSWETVRELNAKGTSYSNTSENAGTNYDLTKAYDIRLVVSDKVGQSISMASISTSSTVMSWSDKGVGIGKIVENGRILDVAGDVYVDGDIYHNGIPLNKTVRLSSSADLNTYKTTGLYFNPYNAQAEKISNTATNRAFLLEVVKTEWDFVYQTFTDYEGQKYYRRYYDYLSSWDDWRKVMTEADFTSGSNANGNWVRFPDGTQICWNFKYDQNFKWNADFSSSGGLWRTSHNTWVYPIAFKDSEVFTSFTSYGEWRIWYTSDGANTTQSKFVGWSFVYQADKNLVDESVRCLAIGRWK